MPMHFYIVTESLFAVIALKQLLFRMTPDSMPQKRALACAGLLAARCVTLMRFVHIRFITARR